MNKDMTEQDVISALISGQLPEVAAELRAEAMRRWNGRLTPPGHGYSEEAQRRKMEKNYMKRARKAAKLIALEEKQLNKEQMK